MKKKLLFRSFWNFDIYFDKELLELSKNSIFEWKNFHQRVEFLTENFEQYQNKINFVALESFLEQYGEKNTKYDLIWVFTKQDNEYSQTDTYGIYLLLHKYVKKSDFKWKINILEYEYQIILNHIYNEQRIHDVFLLSLSRYQNEQLFEFYDKIYCNITGWTKIMTLILLNVIKKLFGKESLQLCYWLWNKKDKKTIFKMLDSDLVL